MGLVKIRWHLGDVVRKLRNARGWSQSKLASLASVNKATIVSVEQMDRSHGQDTYASIAKALGLTLSQLYALIPDESGDPDSPMVHTPTGQDGT